MNLCIPECLAVPSQTAVVGCSLANGVEVVQVDAMDFPNYSVACRR